MAYIFCNESKDAEYIFLRRKKHGSMKYCETEWSKEVFTMNQKT